MSKNLDSDHLNRLWAHAMHEDDAYNNRQNFFLVFESVLLGAVGVLFSVMYNKPLPGKLLLVALTLLGFLLTLFWGYLQARQQDDYNVVVARLLEADPEYQEYRTLIARREQQKWAIRGKTIPSMSLLTYGIPFLVALIWICFLVVILMN